jgi:anhydro-N-acetylmuramic acid kinase
MKLFSSAEWISHPRLVCGIMSGTSLDGIDVALLDVSTSPVSGRHEFKLYGHATIAFPDDVRTDLYNMIHGENMSTAMYSRMNTAIAYCYASAVRTVCKQFDREVREIGVVGMHGQTVWHEPNGEEFGTHTVRHTWQIGSPSALAQILGVPVVGDLRSADMALGGQGAPLAPMFDYVFLAQPDKYVVALNIGGISNVTFLPPQGQEHDVIAFDTGPGNILSDLAMKKFYGKRYDENGHAARAGKLLPKLMMTLQQEPYIVAAPPKSTGRELFTPQYLDRALQYNYHDFQPAEDAIRTLAEFTGWSIAENIRRFGNERCHIIAAGGGTHNPVMIETLRRELPSATYTTTDEQGIPADAKEAMFFGYYAYRTLAGMHSNMPSVTGASRQAVLGVVAAVE